MDKAGWLKIVKISLLPNTLFKDLIFACSINSLTQLIKYCCLCLSFYFHIHITFQHDIRHNTSKTDFINDSVFRMRSMKCMTKCLYETMIQKSKI